MPAGRVSRCESCYSNDLLQRRAAISVAALTSPPIAACFLRYAKWLGTCVGSAKASRLVVRHLGFFREIERRWAAVPSTEELLEAFGTARLRRNMLVTRFFEDQCGDSLSAKKKADAADFSRIDRALDGIALGSAARSVMSSYREALLEQRDTGRLKVRSVRLALTAAKGLILASEDSPRGLPDQASLDAYLRTRPGQRAALAGFVSHLRRHGSGELLLPKKRRRTSVETRSRVESELRRLLASERESGVGARKLLAMALQYFHGVPSKAAGRLGDPSVLFKSADGDWYIRIDGRRYWIPVEVAIRCR
jgi:hypothetical protein